MTMNEATAALIVPANLANNNCVQDAQWRLRDLLKLASNSRSGEDTAPDYVARSVTSLKSWL